MRGLVISLGAAAAISAGTAGAMAQSLHAPAINLSVLAKSGPHSISLKHELVTFYFKITGVAMHSYGPHVKNKSGQGHIRIYLDRVPRDAYRKNDPTGIASEFAAGKLASGHSAYAESVTFDNAWIKIHKGKHTLRIGIARNNGVMYRVTLAPFSLDVK